MADRLETREVLADAYPRGRRSRSMLTHVCVVDEAGRVTAVVCGTVQVDSIADAGSMSRGGKFEPPTCPRCWRKVRERWAREAVSAEFEEPHG